MLLHSVKSGSCGEEGTSGPEKGVPVQYQDDVNSMKRIRFSSYTNSTGPILDEGYLAREALTTVDLDQGVVSDYDRSNDYEAFGAHEANHFNSLSMSDWEDDTEAALNSTFWSDSSVHVDTLQLYSKEVLARNVKQVMMEADKSREEAFVELMKRKETESKAASAFAKIKDSDSAKKHEMKMREELEVVLVATRKQHEDLIKNKERAVSGLDSSMRRLAILDANAEKIKLRIDEFSAELEVIQSSIESLCQKKLKMQKLENRHIDLDKGCTYSHATLSNCVSNAFGDDLYSFREFTMFDMQSATCNFSESFKIWSQGRGCVYKGEIMNRTVMIYKLHCHTIESVRQFQQEVYILSKVRHPHLVTLIGACPEALCLVYEYLPNGSLHDRLFSRCNSRHLPWKIRARIVAEISDALLYLHSCKPQMIVHGNLKVENILLDTECHCKIADFGISRLFTDGMKDYPSGSSELEGSFLYADPEYKRSNILTPKSDVYYFGIVILQLLTGKQEPAGLAGEVRRAMSCGKLSSVLDLTAGQWPMEVAGRLAELGLRCSEDSSRDRPDLTPETVRELEQLHLIRQERAPSSFLCPIMQEVMHDPQVCADGVTYEGWAIRERMETGQGTSPLNNLKLEHLNLTPNHALRFAIQDWLRHSR